MNIQRDLREMIVRAALSPRAAKWELSANDTHQMALFAARAHDALAFVRIAAEHARDQGGAIEPQSLLDFLTDNNLMLVELSNGKEITQDQGNQPAGAAVA